MKNIKRYEYFILENKVVKENIDINDSKFEIIASEIEKGFTNGDTPEIWELEVNLKDWVKLDDEDVDMIASQIRSGETQGNDPIDWCLEFGSDSFDIEEEEEILPSSFLDVKPSEIEDSGDLSDMVDNYNNKANKSNYIYNDAKELFDAYKDNNDVSRFFSPVISKDFDYDKEKTLFNDIIAYYPEFKNEFGSLEEFGSYDFNKILKNMISKFFAYRGK